MFAAYTQNISYSFQPCVNDSLLNGVKHYSNLYKKSTSELKLYVLLVPEGDGYGLYMQEYSALPESGYLDLIKASNRRLKVSKSITLPILFQSDILSNQIKKDKIAALPLTGYYLKITTEKYKQKVTQVSILF
jgi:hypothetical protein